MRSKPQRKFKKSGVAPLVEVDPLELTDKRLSPEEAVCREREELLKVAGKHRIHGQDELENKQRSMGPRMSSSELISRLRRCNPDIRFVDGSPGSVAIYIHKKRHEYQESDFMPDPTNPNKDRFFVDHKYVGGFPLRELPEWGHVALDTSRLPTREVRGWRSVLIALIKGGALTYKQAAAGFGDPFLGCDSRAGLWKEQLHTYRQ